MNEYILVILILIVFPALVGIICTVADRIQYGNWIWRTKR